MKTIRKSGGQGEMAHYSFSLSTSSVSLTIFCLLTLLLAACSQAQVGSLPSYVDGTALTTIGHSTNVSQSGSGVDPITLPNAQLGMLTAIRMLDQQHGWALAEHAILKTRDGGAHWRNITPPNTKLSGFARGDFMDSRHAWIVNSHPNGAIFLLRSSDGGLTWQSTTIPETEAMIGDMPHFLTAQEGWLEVVTHGGPGAGSESVDILHTTDGGLTWNKLASTDQQSSGLPRGGIKTGISFKDSQNGWATGHDASNNVWLYATHNGGLTWQSQPVIDLPGYYGTDATQVSYATTPPVFFGTDGLLPVAVQGQLDSGPQAAVHGFILCVTHDGGQTWFSNWKTMPFSLTTFNTSNLYIANLQHAWAGDEQTGVLYSTKDSGQSWQKIADKAEQFKMMSFVDMLHGWAINSANGVLVHTNDGGRSWQPIHA